MKIKEKLKKNEYKIFYWLFDNRIRRSDSDMDHFLFLDFFDESKQKLLLNKSV